VIRIPACTEIFLVTTVALFPSQGTSVIYLNGYRYSSSLTKAMGRYGDSSCLWNVRNEWICRLQFCILVERPLLNWAQDKLYVVAVKRSFIGIKMTKHLLSVF